MPPYAGRKRDDGEARPVPVVREREILDVAEHLVVPAATQRGDDRDRRLDDRVDAVLGEPIAPRVRVLGAADLQAYVLLGRHRPSFCVLEASPIRRAVPVPPVVEATVIYEHLGEDEVEEVGEDVEPSRWGRRLDTLAGKRRERPIQPVGNVRLEHGDAWRDCVAAKRPPRSRRGNARHPSEHELGVDDRPGHRPGMVERPRKRHDPPHRDETTRRLDRRRPALGRGDAQRAGGVRARGRWYLSRCERRARPSTGTAGGSLERPRVADLIGGAAAGELVCVHVAEQHHALGGEPGPDVAVAIGYFVEQGARGGQRLAGNGIEILETDRDPAECRGVALCESLVSACGGLERVFLVDADPGVDRLRVTFVAVRAVSLADAREARVDEFARRDRPLPECRGRILQAEVGRIVHAAIISRLDGRSRE